MRQKINHSDEPAADAATLISIPPVPIYYQLQTVIQQDIEEGRLKLGDAIVSERKMAERYRVSVGTVRHAIAALVNAGFLIRLQGKGTFVNGTTRKYRYYGYMSDFGKPEAPATFTFKSLRRVPALPGINAALRIAAGQELLELKRLMSINGEKTVYSISYFPLAKCKKLEQIPTGHFEKISIFKLIEQLYSLPTVSNKELLSVTTADEEVSRALQIETGSPLLLIKMLAYTHKEKAYEYRKSFCITTHRGILREF